MAETGMESSPRVVGQLTIPNQARRRLIPSAALSFTLPLLIIKTRSASWANFRGWRAAAQLIQAGITTDSPAPCGTS